MSTMKKLIESVDAGIANEGPMGMPMASPMPPEDKGNPVSVNVSMNASGKEHVADLLDMMKNAGLDGAEEVSGPSLSPRMDMEKFRDIIDTDGDNMPSPEEDVDEITKAQEKLPPQLQKAIKDKEEKEGDVEEWANSAPGEEASDRGDMGDYEDNIRDGSDLHRRKKGYKATAGGDNPMSVESIKATLMKALNEKKAKPDFLDMDKDGDKKEPMKKAIKDKKSKKESVEEGAFKKAGAKGDGSAKFDEMGCKKEMMKLNQSGCAKHEMYQKVGEKYGCSKANFEKLYASHCG
jgi:hypothetical protein